MLDYGGDHGDLVRGLLDGAMAFVYDISGAPAAEGVTAISDPAECQAELIINSNVLEHVGFPRRLVGEILQAAPRGGLVFLEVPCEAPFGLARIVRRVAQIGIMGLMRPALARSVVCPGRPLHDARAHQLFHGAFVDDAAVGVWLRGHCGRKLRLCGEGGQRPVGVVFGNGSVAVGL